VGLVNLLAPKPLVPELLQERARVDLLLEETEKILDSDKVRRAQLKSFDAIKKSLATPMTSSRMAAREILKTLTELS
ncbi:MAG: lipid-A-disaccharide synthase, partial [bacterium]